MKLIGIDFSINKPSVCLLKDKKYIFFGWPYGMKDKHKEQYLNVGVNIIDRTDNKEKGDNVSSKLRYEVRNASYLSNLIFASLLPHLDGTDEIYIGIEGLSYGSSGDVLIQLGGYKYMFMNKLSELVPLENVYTYAPLTVKKTADCSKRGMNKNDMINAFINSDIKSDFKDALKNNTKIWKKKGGKNWIDHVDDLVDAFFVLETLREKNFLTIPLTKF